MGKKVDRKMLMKKMRALLKRGESLKRKLEQTQRSLEKFDKYIKSNKRALKLWSDLMQKMERELNL